jgi:hypothetical protein
MAVPEAFLLDGAKHQGLDLPGPSPGSQGTFQAPVPATSEQAIAYGTNQRGWSAA